MFTFCLAQVNLRHHTACYISVCHQNNAILEGKNMGSCKLYVIILVLINDTV